MKKGIAKAEVNNEPSLTIPAQTRTPLEAFKMLRAGQPIDLVQGYYEKKGLVTKDFYMMDKTERLRALAQFREQESMYRSDYEEQLKQYQSQFKNEVNENNQPGDRQGSEQKE